MAAIVVGLALGKPLGIAAASFLAVRLGLAVKPREYSWAQLLGAGSLAGIGFTMSLFIAGQAFSGEADFEAAKIAVFAAPPCRRRSGSRRWFSQRERADELPLAAQGDCEAHEIAVGPLIAR